MGGDDVSLWAVPLDEPAAAPPAPLPPVAATPEPPRLTLLSQDVPAGDFQPRLRLGGDPE